MTYMTRTTRNKTSFRPSRWVAAAALLATPTLAWADDFSAGDTAFMMIATAMVMLMTPAGLALFYGGLTQRKSVINTVGMSYVAFCVAILAWMLCGYSFAFGTSGNSFYGGFEDFALRSLGVNDLTGTIPTTTFILFQGTFAAIAVAIVSGSIIERVRFISWLVFAVLWVILCYAPIAHWVWGGGFLSGNGELDFAGGTVVHISSGVSGLTLAILLGRRQLQKEEYQPYSIKLTMLGSALLWFGWFGFNAGSALAADYIASNAMLVTCVAAAAGGIAWLIIAWSTRTPRSLLGAASGVVCGLVGITPAAGFVDFSGALLIGALAGGVGYISVTLLKSKIGYDDSLDAFGIHGAVGIFGSLAVGLLANPAINGEAGVFYGDPGQFLVQLKAVVVVTAYSAVVTVVLYYITTLITRGGLRISKSEEAAGIDQSYHREQVY